MIGLGLSIPEVALRRSGSLTPAQIAGTALVAAWDAENVASLSLAVSAVAAWTDSKGGAIATQDIIDSRPTWSATSFNGRPGIAFDGVDDFLNMTGVGSLPVGTAPSEIWALVSQTSPASEISVRTAFGYGGASTSGRLAGRTVASGVNRATASATVAATKGVVDFTGIHVIRAIFTNSAVSVTLDGEPFQASGASAINTTSVRIRIGANTSATAGGFWLSLINSIFVINQADPTWNETVASQFLLSLKRKGGLA